MEHQHRALPMLLAVALSLTAAPVPVRFLDPVARVQPGPKSGTAFLLLRLDSPTKEQAAAKDAPTFADLELPTALAAKVQVAGVVETTIAGDTPRTWRIDLVVDGLQMPLERRYATISWLGQKWPLDYQLSSQPSADFKWDVLGLPTEWNLNRDRCTSLRISQSAPATTGVTLAATLSEETSKELLGPKTLYLTADPTKPANQNEIDFRVNDGKPIYICVDDSFFGDATRHGKFTGTVTLASTQKPDGKTLSLTAYRAGLQFLGVLLIIVGTIAAYLIKVYAPARLARDQELQPVALLTEQIGNLRAAVETIPPAKVPNVSETLDQLAQNLSIRQLEARKLIHRVPPIPFGDTVDTAALQTLLSESGAKIALISIIVRVGLIPAKALEIGAPGRENVIDQAYTTMDNRLVQVPAPTIDQLRTQIQNDLNQLRNNLAPGAVAAPGAPVPETGVSFERIQLSLASLSGTIWFVWAALAVVAGIVFLVYTNLSFGRPVDYFYCLVWGFGITAAGQQSVSSLVTSGLGVTLPKTT